MDNTRRLLSHVSLIISIIVLICYLTSLALELELEFWKRITLLGDEIFYVGMLPIIYHGVSRVLGIELVITVMFTLWFGGTLKNVFKIPRPPRKLWLIEASGYSFPSGHALGSTVFWGYLALWYRELLPLALTLVIFISASRVILRVHYLNDILGGIFLGILILISSILIKKLVKKLNFWIKVLLLLLVGFMFILSSLILSVPTSISYPTLGTMLGGILGHILLHRRETISLHLSIKERILGSLLGLIIGYIGYKLSAKISDYLLLPYYVLVAFLIIYGVGVIIDKIREKGSRIIP